MEQWLSRSENLIGTNNLEKLKNSYVAVFGLGGVGSFVVEGLIRAGISKLLLVDNDTVEQSNINRQLLATHVTIGKDKVELAKERCLAINPYASIQAEKIFFDKTTISILDSSLDYIVDAIDTIPSKILLIEQAKKLNIPILSCMGTGNKLNPFAFEIADIAKTSVCPLAKKIRKEVKEKRLGKVKVLFSTEEPKSFHKTDTPGSISFVPSVAGLLMASEVVKDLTNHYSF